MVAGLNSKCKIWRENNSDDDAVGGAVITGTVVYSNINIRFQAQLTEQLLLQQGLETPRIFSAVLIPGYLDIRERDLIEVIAPLDHVYYGDEFRIVGMRYSNHNKRDPRNYIMLDMVRSVRAHSRQ